MLKTIKDIHRLNENHRYFDMINHLSNNLISKGNGIARCVSILKEWDFQCIELIIEDMLEFSDTSEERESIAELWGWMMAHIKDRVKDLNNG